MLEPWRMAAPAHLRLAPKSMYMPAGTSTGKLTGRRSIMSIADCNAVLSGRCLSRGQIDVTKQTPEKSGDVSTKRNAAEQY